MRVRPPRPAPFSFFHPYSPVVQSAERLTLTQEVDGANPSGAAIHPPGATGRAVSLFQSAGADSPGDTSLFLNVRDELGHRQAR